MISMLICISDANKSGNIYGMWDNENFPINITNPTFKIKNKLFYEIPNLPTDVILGNFKIIFRIKHQEIYLNDIKLEKTILNDITLEKTIINENEYNIINYINGMYISGHMKYMIYNNILRIYEENSIIAECEMENNMPNGNYIEYENNIKSFHGHIKNGIINGRCVEFYKNGVIKFNGNCINRMRSGEGIIFDEAGTKIFDGNFKNDLKSGHGYEYYNDTHNNKLKYHGWFINDEYNEQGILYDENKKVVYQGTFKNGYYDGNGRLFFPDSAFVKYEGEFKNGEFNGIGKLYLENSIIVKYEGTFKNGEFNGHGIKYNPKHKIYEGEFKNGLYYGIGKQYNSFNGIMIYEGDFKNDLFNGQGVYYLKNQTGKFVNGSYIEN